MSTGFQLIMPGLAEAVKNMRETDRCETNPRPSDRASHQQIVAQDEKLGKFY